MFLHGGLMHIVSNMVFLAAFAPMVEDAMGRGRFLVFYLLGGLAATAAQIAVDPASTVPQLGASGAIAAVMGAFLVTYPGDRIKVLWLFGIFTHVSQVPAFVLIGLWLVTQMLNQAGAVVGEADAGGIAYAAHLGGAFFGMLTARAFEPHVERRAAVEWSRAAGQHITHVRAVTRTERVTSFRHRISARRRPSASQRTDSKADPLSTRRDWRGIRLAVCEVAAQDGEAAAKSAAPIG